MYTTINIIINIYFICPSVNLSVCVHDQAQKKRLTASKFGTEILEKIFEKTSKLFFLKKIDLDFFK